MVPALLPLTPSATVQQFARAVGTDGADVVIEANAAKYLAGEAGFRACEASVLAHAVAWEAAA